MKNWTNKSFNLLCFELNTPTFNKILFHRRQIQSWSPMEMPRHLEMITHLDLENSFESISLPLASSQVVTLSHTFWRSLVSLSNRKLRGLTISSTSCFSLLLLT